MKSVQKAFTPVNICFACNDNYALYLRVALYSLLYNRDRTRAYDILIMHKDISKNNQESILKLINGEEKVSVRFLDMTEVDELVQYKVGAYYSVETNYRLFLLSEMFAAYDRMLYLDCDIVVTGDVSRLFDTDLEGKWIGAVENVEFRIMSKSKRAIFLGNYPYNADNYRTDALKMKHMEDYFNAGVLVLDLQKSRESIDIRRALDTLHSQEFHYNDQDVLNILFDGQVKLLDCKWNYMANIERIYRSGSPGCKELYEGLLRSDYQIIHYISGTKPWDMEIPLGEYYWNYKQMSDNGVEKEETNYDTIQ